MNQEPTMITSGVGLSFTILYDVKVRCPPSPAELYPLCNVEEKYPNTLFVFVELYDIIYWFPEMLKAPLSTEATVVKGSPKVTVSSADGVRDTELFLG